MHADLPLGLPEAESSSVLRAERSGRAAPPPPGALVGAGVDRGMRSVLIGLED